MPINAVLGFIFYYPQFLFLPKFGVTLSTELRIGGVPFITILPLSDGLNKERTSEGEGPERARKTFNEAHSEVR